MTKLTKIIATIGPATETPDVIKQLISAGMNVARFNTKHSDPAWHSERVERIKQVAQEMKTTTGVLLDLQGPEIRTNTPQGQPFEVTPEDLITILPDGEPAEGKTISVPREVVTSLDKGSQILLEDGAVELTITDKYPTHLIAQTSMACTIKHRKTMNTPGVVLEMPSLTERDYQYLDQVNLKLVDFVAISFVRNSYDIKLLRTELNRRECSAQIVAKIENQMALDNLEEIIAAADVVMVARGDLGVEVAFQELIHWQKEIIVACRKLAKPVIVATEMLKSMVEKPRPTRAEVSDVAHSIYDGTDAIMLSDETTIGKYPVKTVETQATIAGYNEPFVTSALTELSDRSTSAALCNAAMTLLDKSDQTISHLICLTETGKTARQLASLHPRIPIIALAGQSQTANQLTVVYGVTPLNWERAELEKVSLEDISQFCLEAGVVKKGEAVLIIHGPQWHQAHETNTISVITIR